MRIAVVALPELRVELARSRDGAKGPIAIVVTDHPRGEASLTGGARVDFVSDDARRAGVAVGQTLAQARARAEGLSVRAVRPAEVKGALERLAEIALGFGATVGMWLAGDGARVDAIGVDITGCAHLFGGEPALAQRLASVVRAQGHACAVAIAEGPLVASMLASAAWETDRGARGVVVPRGQNAKAISLLSIASLPLGPDETRWLTKLGVRTLGELRRLPRAALGARLGARARDVIALAEGDDRSPLPSWKPPETPEEFVELEHGVEGSEALVFIAKTLTDRLSARLSARAMAAAKLELGLTLDGALLPRERSRRKKNPEHVVEQLLPVPLSSASELLSALRPRLEALALAAPVLAARLAAPTLARRPAGEMHLFEPEARADRALPRLLSELAADLGVHRVGRLSIANAWAPEKRSRFVTGAAEGAGGGRGFLDALPDERGIAARVESAPMPTRVHASPDRIDRRDLVVARHLYRLADVEWWQQMPGAARTGGVDHVLAWSEETGAAWVEIDRGSGAAIWRGSFD